MSDSTILREDWKYMEQMPYGDPDFDPEHNRRVIEEVNRENDEMEKKRDREFSEQTKERTTAAAQYLRNVAQGKSVTAIDKYFGKRYLAYLRGKEIVNQLKMNPALVEKMKNKTKNKGRLQPL